MLVIISDLHLTDGSSGETIREGAFRVLRQRLSDLAYDASCRPDRTYRPIEEAHLVLLGDILDVIRSTQWLDGEMRPWSPPQEAAFIDRVEDINTAILKNNAASLDVLSGLAAGGLTISPATSSGKPDNQSRERVPVALRTHYMVGNHDWFYHLPGGRYDAIRRSVVNALGLCNDPAEPFPHDPYEGTATAGRVLEAFEQHRVFARHGDIYDPVNFEENGRDGSSLGDAIVVELLNRFPEAVRTDPVSRDLPEATLAGLKEIDNVRPLFLIPAWIQGLLRHTVSDNRTARRVKAIWDDLADTFLRLPFVRERDRPFRLDIVDTLQAALKISTGLSLGALGKLAAHYGQKLSGAGRYHEYAQRESAFRSRRAHYVVYGHTHHHQVTPLDTVTLPGTASVSQMYLNSGTWRRVHELAVADPSDLEFLHWNVMTYLAFFKDDERQGRPFESWSGTLGVEPQAAS